MKCVYHVLLFVTVKSHSKALIGVTIVEKGVKGTPCHVYNDDEYLDKCGRTNYNIWQINQSHTHYIVANWSM